MIQKGFGYSELQDMKLYKFDIFAEITRKVIEKENADAKNIGK
jgi:hypothetical protein